MFAENTDDGRYDDDDDDDDDGDGDGDDDDGDDDDDDDGDGDGDDDDDDDDDDDRIVNTFSTSLFTINYPYHNIGDLTQVIDYFITTNQYQSLLNLSIRTTQSTNYLNSPANICTKMKSISNWYKINETLFFESDDEDENENDGDDSGDNYNALSSPNKHSATTAKSSSTSKMKQIHNKHHHQQQQLLNLSEIRHFEAVSVFVRTLKYFIQCALSYKYSSSSIDKDDHIHKNVGVAGDSSSIINHSSGSSSCCSSFDVSYLYELLRNRPTILDINYLLDIVTSCVPIMIQSSDATTEEEVVIDINDERISMIIDYIYAL